MSSVAGVGAGQVAAYSWRERLRKSDKLLVASATVCVLVVGMAIFGPMLAPQPPDQTNLLNISLSPGGTYLLGTDSLGRDIFSRILDGARLSVLGPAIVVLAASVFGAFLAITSAWIGGWYDRIVVSIFDLLFAFPGILFALLAVAVLGQGFWAPVIALSIAYTPYLGRVLRGVAVKEKQLPYIDACRTAGFSGFRICGRHIFPNVKGVLLAQATIAFGGAFVDLAAISFLGLGVQPPNSEWGLMVADGSTDLLNGHPEVSLSAGFMIIITVVAFNVLGERLSVRNEARR